MHERIDFMGLSIDRISMNEVLKRIELFVESEKPHRIVFLNALKIVLANSDKELQEIINASDLVLADGMSIVFSLRLLEGIQTERVPGVDLMQQAIELVEKNGYRLYFLGSTPEVVDRIVNIYRTKFPKLKIAGWHHGYFSADEETGILREIRKNRTDILFVAFGSPQKEKWIEKNYRDLHVPVCICVGGSFDVLSGERKRAPRWIQKIGLEWFFRLIQEPRRLWWRYFKGGIIFVWLLTKEVARRYLV